MKYSNPVGYNNVVNRMRKAREDKEMREDEIARSLYYLGSTKSQSAKVKRNQNGGIIPKPFNLESMKLHNRYEELVKEKEDKKEKERLENEQRWKEKRERLYNKIKNNDGNSSSSKNTPNRKRNKSMILCVEIKISPCRSAMFELYEGDDVELAVNIFMRENEVDKIYKTKLLKTIQNQLKVIEDESEIQSLPPPPPPPPEEEEEEELEVQEIEDS